MNTYTKLIDKHKGKSAFILGAGPSLYDLCISFRFKKIFDHVVIAVNSAFMAISEYDIDPEKHYWVSNDVLCRQWSYWKDVENSKCTKVVRDSWLKYKNEMKNTYFFSPRPTSEDVINLNDKGLAYCSSVPSAIDLSLQFGCKNIFLFGVDHKQVDGRCHYWQFLYPRKERPTVDGKIYDTWEKQKKVFKYNDMAYKALLNFSILKEAEIYNCSNNTNVGTFKHTCFEAALHEANKSKENY